MKGFGSAVRLALRLPPVWFAFHESGIHATIAGVAIGLMTPARSYLSETLFAQILDRAARVVQGGGFASLGDRAGRVRDFQRAAREAISPLEYLESVLHPWVGFAIMPLSLSISRFPD